ncbi:MAG: nitroreductase family protein [Rothia aeria]
MIRKIQYNAYGDPSVLEMVETDEPTPGEGEVRVTVHQSCSLAIQTFLLAMAEAGYDTCPLGGFDNKLVKKALKLPRGSQVCMVIACGKRAEDGVWGERFRLPFETFYHQV